MVNTQIRNVAIVGTGLIGASWAAQYLASGLDVIAVARIPRQTRRPTYAGASTRHGSYSRSLASL